MPNENKLSAVLSEFARTLITDVPMPAEEIDALIGTQLGQVSTEPSPGGLVRLLGR